MILNFNHLSHFANKLWHIFDLIMPTEWWTEFAEAQIDPIGNNGIIKAKK